MLFLSVHGCECLCVYAHRLTKCSWSHSIFGFIVDIFHFLAGLIVAIVCHANSVLLQGALYCTKSAKKYRIGISKIRNSTCFEMVFVWSLGGKAPFEIALSIVYNLFLYWANSNFLIIFSTLNCCWYGNIFLSKINFSGTINDGWRVGVL